MGLIVAPQRLQIARNGAEGLRQRVVLPASTSEIILRIGRETSGGGVVFRSDARIASRIIVRAGAQDFVCSGLSTGGVRGLINEYALRYRLPRGFFGGETSHRLGDRVSTFDLLVELLLEGSAIDAQWSLETIDRDAPDWRIHHSVAFDTATDAVETGGDGVLSLSHTAGGSDRAAFAGVTGSNVANSTGVTYAGNAMTEQWDVNATCGYTIAGDANVPASSQTVTSTLGGSSPNTHTLGVVSLTGVDAGTPVGTPQSTSASGTSISVTVTGLTTDGLVIDCVGSFNSPPRDHTPGANQTGRTDQAGNNQRGSISTQSSNDGGAMSWTTSDSAFIDMGAIEFKPAAASEDIVAAGSLSISGAADLDATGSLSAAGTLSIAGAADLDGTGTLAAAGAVSISGAASLDGANQEDVAAAGSLSISGSADLDGTGTLAAAGSVAISGAADLDARGALNSTGALSISGVADLDARGTLAALGALAINGVAELTEAGNPSITSIGSLSISGSAVMNAIGQLAAVGGLSIAGAADASQQRDVSAVGGLSIAGSAAITATGALSLAGQISIFGAAFLMDANAGAPNVRRARSRIVPGGDRTLKLSGSNRTHKVP